MAKKKNAKKAANEPSKNGKKKSSKKKVPPRAPTFERLVAPIAHAVSQSETEWTAQAKHPLLKHAKTRSEKHYNYVDWKAFEVAGKIPAAQHDHFGPPLSGPNFRTIVKALVAEQPWCGAAANRVLLERTFSVAVVAVDVVSPEVDGERKPIDFQSLECETIGDFGELLDTAIGDLDELFDQINNDDESEEEEEEVDADSDEDAIAQWENEGGALSPTIKYFRSLYGGPLRALPDKLANLQGLADMLSLAVGGDASIEAVQTVARIVP